MKNNWKDRARDEESHFLIPNLRKGTLGLII